MKHKDQKDPLRDHPAATGRQPSWIKWSVAGSAFVGVLIAVFLLSNRIAETTVVGFPNFQDSEFALLDQNGDTGAQVILLTSRSRFFSDLPIVLIFAQQH